MKKPTIFLCLFLSVLALYAKGIQEDYRRAEEKARVSYAFGMLMGSNLQSTGIDFDYNAFTDGVRAMLGNGIPQLSEQEAIEIIETALKESMERSVAESRRREYEFLARNMERPEVSVTSSGLQYEILVEAEGDTPSYDSIVWVNYAGTFTDGTPFDSSSEEDGAYIPLSMVIPGWTEGLMLMNKGSTYRFYIPSSLAYGSDGIQGIIPPYSTLIFTVDLLDIISSDDLNLESLPPDPDDDSQEF